MSQVQIINHKGIEIIYTVFSDAKTEQEFYSIMELQSNEIRSKSPKSAYTLTNFENAFFNKNIATKISESLKLNAPHVKHSVLIGISGLLGIMVNGIAKLSGRDLHVCNSFEEAQDYLASKA